MNLPSPLDVSIIGAGPAGLACAHSLAKSLPDGRIRSVALYEADATVGGLSKSLTLWGQTVDLGPHRFFSTDPRVNRFWLEVAGGQYAMVDRLTRIYYQHRFFHYPLRPLDALKNLGPLEALRCLSSYVRERLLPTPADGSFEAWVVRRFGRRLYRTFFQTYSERLWGIPCADLDADFASQRIRKLSLYHAIQHSLMKGAGTPHKTLVERFAYPCGGTGLFYRRMADAFERAGGNLHLRCPVRSVLQAGGRVTGIELEDGRQIAADAVVSTMPLSLLVSRLPEAPGSIRDAAAALRYRNTILVYVEVDHPALFPDQWLYIHSPDVTAGRITNFRNWHASLHGELRTSILCLEYWCDHGDPLWSEPDSEITARALRDLTRTKLLNGAAVNHTAVFRLSRSYPVYFRGYKERLKPVEAYLSTIAGLHVIGRYGAYKYNNQDHSLLMGLLAAGKILTGTGADLWDINTDYDDYQEASAITETGLDANP